MSSLLAVDGGTVPLSELSGDIVTKQHLQALRFLPIYPANNVFPPAFLPADGETDFEEIAALFSEAFPRPLVMTDRNAFTPISEALGRMSLRRRGLFDDADRDFDDCAGEARWPRFELDDPSFDEQPREQWTLFHTLIDYCFMPMLDLPFVYNSRRRKAKWIVANSAAWSARTCGDIYCGDLPYPVISLNAVCISTLHLPSHHLMDSVDTKRTAQGAR
jgi:hypothetical protein